MNSPETLSGEDKPFRLKKRQNLSAEIERTVIDLSKKELASGNDVRYSCYFGSYPTISKPDGTEIFRLDQDQLASLSHCAGLLHVDLNDAVINATLMALHLIESGAAASAISIDCLRAMKPDFRLILFSLLYKGDYGKIAYYQCFLPFFKNHDELLDLLFQVPQLRKDLIYMCVMNSDKIKVSSKKTMMKYLGYCSVEEISQLDNFEILRLLRSLGYNRELEAGMRKAGSGNKLPDKIKAVLEYDKYAPKILENEEGCLKTAEPRKLYEAATRNHPEIVLLMSYQTSMCLMRTFDEFYLSSSKRNYKKLYGELTPARAVLDVIFDAIRENKKIPEDIVKALGEENVGAVCESLETLKLV